MKIINIAASIEDHYENDEWICEVFQLRCFGTVLIQEEAPYAPDGDDLELWAAEKLKGLFK